MQQEKKARVISFYLPQFHPIPENDKWWGKGFTEWTNVAKAKPLFKGHYQPKIPADLGFYDLRMNEARVAQAQLAQDAGIEGFCYWRYWFGKGKELLDTPFKEVLASGKPDFPFCVGWANHSWSSYTWEKGSSKVSDVLLMEQTYIEEDYVAHFYELLPAFRDRRYITVDGKPLFVVFDPMAIPDASVFINTFCPFVISLISYSPIYAATSNAHLVLVLVFSKISAIFLPFKTSCGTPFFFFSLRSAARSIRYSISSLV